MAVLLSACGGGPPQAKIASPSPFVRTSDLGPAYQRNSCAFDFNDGQSAPNTMPAARIEKAHFQKEFDRSRLQALKSLSAKATVDFAERDGVDIFAVPVPSLPGCRMYGSLAAPSNDLLNVWRGIGRENIIAVFLSLDRTSPFGLSRPAILMRADTDRYSLVHEYMHFLFNHRREQRGYRDRAFLERLEERTRAFRALAAVDAGSSPEAIRTYTRVWSEFAESVVELSENYSLEEIAIEALLNQAARDRELEHVTEFDLDNSNNYIRGSYQRASTDLSALQVEGLRLKEILLERSLDQESSAVSKVLRRIEQDLSEARALVKKYAPGGFLAIEDAKLAGLASGVRKASDSLHSHAGCSHGSIDRELKDRGIIFPWSSSSTSRP